MDIAAGAEACHGRMSHAVATGPLAPDLIYLIEMHDMT